MEGYTDQVRAHLGRLYAEDARRFACRAGTPDQMRAWQDLARPQLRKLVGLARIAADNAGHVPAVDLDEPEDMGEYTRRRGRIRTEPDFVIPFWLLRPKGDGPFPLGVFPHGHGDYGMNPYVGISKDEAQARKIADEDRDVAVQAVRRGFVAVAPTTRGFEPAAIPDVYKRHGERGCRSAMIHAVLAGRTIIGERVWDVEKVIDWASALSEVDARTVLVMGNSGGGVLTLYAAACDPRVTIAVPSCSFCTIVGENGRVHHCDCNAVPGIMAFGEFHDVASLIAPRRLLIVNGRTDTLFPLEEIDKAAANVARAYAAAGVPGAFAHKYGQSGHRFYKDLMWPFIEKAMENA
jgi:dienelactone hydrolase